MEQHDQLMTLCLERKQKNSFNEGKLNTAKEIADFSSTFVISEELVKIYLDHLKHLYFPKICEVK